MVKYKFLFFCILFVSILSSNLFAEELNSFEYLKLKITNDIEFSAEVNEDTKIKYFFLTSYFFPQTFDNAQYLNEYNTNYDDYEFVNHSGILDLKFSYNKNSLKSKNVINNEFIVESIVNRPEIKKKVKYPLEEKVEINYLIYTQFANLIDMNSQIKTQASILAQGEDDVYIIASKIAKWIYEDINYDLSTVTQNPNQKSSEVFESKSGVCKEITNLYISMMRSLGIPARIVTGFSYTTSEDVVNYIGSNWGGHAWAEVLIEDEWVPFDLTYNQYGFVDATHLILDKSDHIRDSSVSINASGSQLSLVKNSLKTDTKFEIVDSEEKIYNVGYDVEISGNDRLGFGSYGYVKVNVKNTDDFYKVLFLRLSKVEEVELLDSNNKMEIFKPNEEKEIYFRFKLPENLDEGFIYTFPFKVYNEFIDKEYNLKVKEDYQTIKLSSLPEDAVEEKIFSDNDLNFECNFVFDIPKNKIFCSVRNPNNYEVNDLNICIENDCRSLDLKLNEQKSFSFNTNEEEVYLNYEHSKNEGLIGLVVQKPKINYSYDLQKNKLTLKYNNFNYIEGLKTVVLINNKEEFNSDLNSNSEVFTLNNTENNIDIELKYKNEVIDSKKSIVSVDKRIIKKLYGNFFERLWYNFLELFE